MKLVARTLGTVAVAAVVVAAGTVPATATGKTPGTNSLAAVLAADGDTFDGKWGDYDVTTEAVNAVLAAKPDSPVGVLADGTVALTAFVPDDRSFRILVNQISGQWVASDEAAFEAVAASASTPSRPSCSTTWSPARRSTAALRPVATAWP